MSNLSEQGNRKHECPNKRECFEMLQLILDGEASPKQKDTFLNHTGTTGNNGSDTHKRILLNLIKV